MSDETTAAGYFSRAEVERMEISAMDRARIADAFAMQAAAILR